MHEPLREVPKVLAGRRIHFLGVEADVGCEADELAIRSFPSSVLPARPSASTSQKEQVKKAPSTSAEAAVR